MSAMVNIGQVTVGSAANATGVFNGHNMQNDWDSHAPNISSTGGIMGNWSVESSHYALIWNTNNVGQPIADNDYKMNVNRVWIGP